MRELGEWEKPPALDNVTNMYRPLQPRDVADAKAAARSIVGRVASAGPNAVRIAATNLMARLSVGDAPSLAGLVVNPKLDPNVRASALTALADANDPGRLQQAVDAAMSDKSAVLRRVAIRIVASQPDGVKRVVSLLEKGTISDKQAVLTGLGSAKGPEADAILSAWLDRLLAGSAPAELHLDLLEAAAERKRPELTAKVEKYQASLDTKNPLSAYIECLTGGDAAAGHQIFRERADVSCIRCHTASGEGGVVGPVLDGIGAKQTREYLLESIVYPNAKIAPGFESLIIQTKEGKFRVGILKRETETEVELLNPDAEPDKQKVIVAKSDIKSRDRGPSAMPEGLIKALSKRDLRNLVEFLASLKQGPPDAAAPALGHGK